MDGIQEWCVLPAVVEHGDEKTELEINTCAKPTPWAALLDKMRSKQINSRLSVGRRVLLLFIAPLIC
eukprot:4546544-Pleurochrysis_carterae.AAC.1